MDFAMATKAYRTKIDVYIYKFTKIANNKIFVIILLIIIRIKLNKFEYLKNFHSYNFIGT